MTQEKKEHIRKTIVTKPFGHLHNKVNRRERILDGSHIMGRLFAVLMMAAGLIILVHQDHIYRILSEVLGISMFFLGLYYIVCGIIEAEHRNHETKVIANGIVLVIFGVLLFVNYTNTDAIIGAIWGVFGVFNAAEELNHSLYSLGHREPYVGKMIYAGIELMLGIMLLVGLPHAVHHHIPILGIEMMLMGWQIFHESEKEEHENMNN